MKILVTGATGLIGCHAAARLAHAGHAVRALVRDADKLSRVLAPFAIGDEVEARPGDVTDLASVEYPIAIEDSLRDTIGWMAETGILGARHAGRLFSAGERAPGEEAS